MSTKPAKRKGPINSPSELPGHRLPLNFGTHGCCKDTGLLPSAVNWYDGERGYAQGRVMAVKELQMLRLMNRITDKAEWETKVFDETIAGAWKTEAQADETSGISKSMADWVIDELRWKADFVRQDGYIDVYPGDVVKSDTAVSESVRVLLQRAIHALEDVSDKDEQWHPWTNSLIRDLVGPYMFPLVYGTSRILTEGLVPLHGCKAFIGKGQVLPIPDTAETSHGVYGVAAIGDIEPYSYNFQCLPCNVHRRVMTDNDEEDDASPWQITSYINNLDPDKHADLYAIVEQVISAAVPLWNKTLDPLNNATLKPHPHRIRYDEVKDMEGEEDDSDGSNDEYAEEDSIYTDPDLRRFVRREREALKSLSPRSFSPPEMPGAEYDKMDLAEQFGESGLQVIVQFTNIELSPGKPPFRGGSWHVLGQLNDHICATALYYYDNENITDSHLSFRHLGSKDIIDEIPYPPGVDDWLETVFDISDHEPATQILGSVLCRQNRLVTFPNLLHRNLDPFGLVDPTKPGHRKVLALHLVDPNIRIISTANVPPQQRNWWLESLDAQKDTRIGHLPPEIRDWIYESLADDDFPPSLEMAKAWQEDLMEERCNHGIGTTDDSMRFDISLFDRQ